MNIENKTLGDAGADFQRLETEAVVGGELVMEYLCSMFKNTLLTHTHTHTHTYTHTHTHTHAHTTLTLDCAPEGPASFQRSAKTCVSTAGVTRP